LQHRFLVSAAIGFDEQRAGWRVWLPFHTRLYLDFEVDPQSSVPASEVLSAALEAAPIASVLIRPKPGATMIADKMQALVGLGQKHGAAVLLTMDAEQAADVGADGIHLAPSADAVDQLKTARRVAAGLTIGAGAGNSRHAAMELGEAGADYIAFTIPAGTEDRANDREGALELVAWWNEIFELPSVWFGAAGPEDARRLADAGADFVALTVSQSGGPGHAAAAVRAFADALSPSARVE
jgi:thiamine-phosphate pyrophosphorylase